jgi:hypothetical protein
MLPGMASDKLVYYRANRLIEQHGAGAMKEADRLLSRALERRERDLTLVMLRVRSAVAALQHPPNGAVH